MAANLDAVIALNRFGLGARSEELQRVKSAPREWLAAQVNGNRLAPEPIAKLASSVEVFKKYADAQEARRDARREQLSDSQAQQVVQGIRQVLVPIYLQQVAARYQVAGTSDEPLRERLIHFWTNHFAVSADKVVVLGLAGTLENEAIRPHLANRFVDMLLAVEQHPAMILYLDNQQSSGPNSQRAKLSKRRPNAERTIGSNENLAREILELHTLGVNGGYTQIDVTTFAQALTGWSVGGGRGSDYRNATQSNSGEFIFRDAVHEPGAKTILGKRYGEAGQAQAKAVLEDLARHPSTAKLIATKLVRHFVSDEPPHSAVEKIAKVFRDSEGHLPTVHRAVIELAQAWQAAPTKFKTPHEFVVSSFRALNFVPRQPQQVLAAFDSLGQRPYTPGSPAGWPDTANHWDGPDALMKRIEWATGLGGRTGSRTAPLELAEQVLGASVGDHTRTAITRAASGAQALTLLLMSPEFQRR